jgi:thymidylate synthase ThyX
VFAKVIEDSRGPDGQRLTTFQLAYWRAIHAELLTHRVFSRNASSSRAIPVSKFIEQVRYDPACPVHWGSNQPGMQAGPELNSSDAHEALSVWRAAAASAADFAERLADLGLHKQVSNRLLEPFQWIHVIVTASEWDNFFELRDHPDAQPEIRHLARLMKAAKDRSTPVQRRRDRQHTESWHLPYITREERIVYWDRPLLLAQISAARCARVSYLKHDGKSPTVSEDLALYERLVGSRPLHASPVEHQGYPLPRADQWDKNFKGWRQHRTLVEAAFA